MMTVRFPNGQAVQYNNANFIERSSEYSDIYEHKDGIWIAQVPNSCVVEKIKPCRVYNPLATVSNESLVELKKEVQALRRKLYRMK
jgi:hypothetical protein